jgi:hypothetical protein
VSRRSSRLAVCLLLASAFRPSGGRAHTPITTSILFNREVVRILKDNCLGCHRPGGIAPMSLATYEEARPWAKAIKEELLERRMPPWQAVKGFGEFKNAPLLSQRDVDIIVNWVEGGAPKGDAALLPPGPLFGTDWPLGQPSAVLSPDAPNDVAAEADQRVDIKLKLPGPERWLTAFDIQPGNASVVHCAALFLDGNSPSLLGTWVPGARPVEWPGDVARRLPAGAPLRLNIHYRGAGEAAADKSTVGLYYAKQRPMRELRELTLTRSGESARIPAAADALAIVPRSDPRLVSLQATAYRPDGTSEVLVWTRDPRADWRQTLSFKKPVGLPAASRIEVVAHPAHASVEPLATLYYTMRSSAK